MPTLAHHVPDPAQVPAGTTLTITRPDDWHLHLRDDVLLQAVLPHTAAQFRRAIVMPHLRPPATTSSTSPADN